MTLKLPTSFEDFYNWRVFIHGDQCNITACARATARTGRPAVRSYHVIADLAATPFTAWRLLAAPRYQEGRSRFRTPAGAEDFAFVTALTRTALAIATDLDLQVWNAGNAPTCAALRERFRAIIPDGQ